MPMFFFFHRPLTDTEVIAMMLTAFGLGSLLMMVAERKGQRWLVFAAVASPFLNGFGWALAHVISSGAFRLLLFSSQGAIIESSFIMLFYGAISFLPALVGLVITLLVGKRRRLEGHEAVAGQKMGD